MGIFGSTGATFAAIRYFAYGFGITLVIMLALQAAGQPPGILSIDMATHSLQVSGVRDAVVAFVLMPFVVGVAAALVSLAVTLNLARRVMQTAISTNRRRHWLLGYYGLKGFAFGFLVFFILLLAGFFLEGGVSFNMPWVLELEASPTVGLVTLSTKPFFIAWLTLAGLFYGWYRIKKQAQYPDESALAEYLY